MAALGATSRPRAADEVQVRNLKSPVGATLAEPGRLRIFVGFQVASSLPLVGRELDFGADYPSGCAAAVDCSDA
ncbi:hypothetical protein Nepgr_021411 [Nepenthes gracilis]|uniref:Uncharacterized protein n=1 Tax=Nepenthes gracilis TaxID=150966 RepID=A0AAD3SYK2_NEPGR|nr:hypothetical protein Nepgr_021411 [Nepenthes gracilis]